MSPLRKIVYGAALLALPLAAAVAGSMLSKANNAGAAAELEKALAAAPAPAPAGELGSVEPFDLAEATDPSAVRGAPLDAPVSGDAIPQGSPIDTGKGGVGEPIRTISPEAWNLLKEAEAAGGGDAMKFEKTPDGQYTKVSFGALGGFDYELPDPDKVRAASDPKTAIPDQIPQAIKALDDQQAMVVGFMVPIDIDREGRVKSFALTQNQTYCCYGVPPAMNEWLMVEMEEGKTADFIMDLPVAAYGKLDVGEEIDDGYVLSIFLMGATEVIDAHELLKRAKG